MNPLPTSSPTISAPVLRARLASRGLAESNHSSALGSEGAGEERRGSTAERRRDPGTLSQSGTQAREPLWNGPRLNSAFVAQVMGQVMMDWREPDSIRSTAAYREAAQIAPGAFFDRGT
ncbi:MAG: hypothetical protein WDM81_12415 [Rhizomicrobium sp.]